MDSRERVLVVIPAHDEAANVAAVVRAVLRAHPTFDVVVIDDGSRDDTGRVAESTGAAVLRHPTRRGYGAALRSGYRRALADGHGVVVTLDGDGQHDPEQIGALLTGLATADVVIGARNLDRPGYSISFARRAGIRVFALLGRMLSGASITDPTSGFTAVRARALPELIRVTPADFPDLNVILALLRAGYVVREVPVTMCARTQGRSMLRGLTPVIYVLKMARYLGEVYRAPRSRDV